MKNMIGCRRVATGWTILLSVLLSAGSIFAQTTDVYFVGNSYTSTYDVPTIFKNLSASGGHTVKTASDIIGGSELAEHWATGKATNDITHTNYDFVVLQEVSDMAYTPATQTNFDIYAHLYNTVITNSGAQTILYMTWVREDHITALTNGIAVYRNMAEQLGCKLSPVGEAWRRVSLQYPAIDLFGADRHHPNEKGAYLSACNFYGAIFNQSPEGSSMQTVGGFVINPTEAAILQRIAWDAVQFVSFTNPPVITPITVDQMVKTNSTPFTFQASATDNGSIANYLWSFGDGTTTNGAALTNVTHSYSTDGSFLVTVKVTDNSGETERTGISVTRDVAGPKVSSITATRTLLTVRFTQDLQPAGAQTLTNYTINGGISVTGATQSASNTVRLAVSSLSAGTQYTLTVNHLYDANGVKIAANTTTNFTYVDSSDMRLRFDLGNTNYLTSSGNWNNVTSNVVRVEITNAIDIYGVPRNITFGLSYAAATIGYSTGPAASNLYPSTAQRDCVYSSKKFSYQFGGLEPSAQYRLTLFASKSATNRETLYTVGGSNAVLDCAYNSNRTVVINGVQSDANGYVTLTVNTNTVNSSGLCYLSVVELENTTPVIQNIEASTGVMNITEGTTSNFQVRLSSQPNSGVTVSVNRIAGEAHVQVRSDSAFFYFNTTNWNTWQSAYIEALNDVDTNSGTATIECADIGSMYASTTVYATQVDTTTVASVYTLIYRADANGSISGTATQTVSQGGSGSAVLASGNTGYHFVNWSDSSTSNPRTDTGVTNNITVTANFAINTYTLTYTAGANGTISGTATQTVNHGSSGSPVTATANSGYYFTSWSDSRTNNPRTDVNVTGSISVTANFAETTPANPQFWVTEYYLTTNQFTGTNYSLTLNQALTSNYFILVRGSRIGDSVSDPDNNYARVTAVPGGRGDLPASASSTNITLSRRAADFTWEGVVTVVECLNSASAGGFKLLDIMDTSMTSTAGVDTCSSAWTSLSRVVPFGGYRGGGAIFNQDATSNAQVVATHVRLYPGGSNTINWVREAAGQTLMNASMTTFVIEWGPEWTVQYVNVAGVKGGSNADVTNEYTTAAISPVARNHTWIWGTGTRNGSGVGTCAEGCLVTLGDGVSTNATESKVAVGSEYTNAYNFAVYTMTHSKLFVDYRKVLGSNTVLDLPVTVATITNLQARFGMVYNGTISTQGGYHPRSLLWSRFTDNSTVTISRGHNGNNFPAWVQAIDFAPLDQ